MHILKLNDMLHREITKREKLQDTIEFTFTEERFIISLMERSNLPDEKKDKIEDYISFVTVSRAKIDKIKKVLLNSITN